MMALCRAVLCGAVPLACGCSGRSLRLMHSFVLERLYPTASPLDVLALRPPASLHAFTSSPPLATPPPSHPPYR